MKNTRNDAIISPMKAIDKKRPDKCAVLKKLPWLLLIPLGLLLPGLASAHPWEVEKIYSRGVYPIISRILSFITGIFPFSVAEVFVCAVALGVIFLLIRAIIQLIRKRRTPLGFISFILSLCIFAGAMLNIFYAAWGFNYSRPTLYQLMELEVKERPDTELQQLCFDLARRANELRPLLNEDEQGVFYIADYKEYFEKIPAAYRSLGKDEPLLSAPAAAAKGVMASEAMSWAGISGIYMPYTAEPNVNVHQPALLMLCAAAHETAHYLGFAREDEANFIAYLACIYSDDPAIEYSGVMLALINCANKLYKSDPNKFAPLREMYSDAMIRDLSAYNAYWDSYEGDMEDTFNSLNDNYLKFNSQQNGIKSYGMMVDLLLAYYSD